MGGGTRVTGVTGSAGEAGVGGGVAVMLTVEAVDIVDTEPELWVWDTPPQLIPFTDVTVAELGNDDKTPEKCEKCQLSFSLYSYVKFQCFLLFFLSKRALS